MIRSVLIFGGGSAGFLAALTLKRRLPELPVTILRSKDIGIIGVGEGTTTTVGYHLHHYCNLDVATFYRLVEPQWKIGIRFEWGPRPYFNYVFGYELDTIYPPLPRGTGYYLDGEEAFETAGLQSRLMHENKIWLRRPDGRPQLCASEWTYHLENEKLVAYFETVAGHLGIPIIEGTATEVLQNDHGISSVKLESGEVLTADLYLDCSGFRSELLGKALGEPFHSYRDSLFCDRAVIGGWSREEEPIKPYTTAETMSSGWCWQIEHEYHINRGYVFASAFASDTEAETEFRTKNPKVQSTRIVPFRAGRYERLWVKNVVAIGNAAGFVEPLEASALSAICMQCQALAEVLADANFQPRASTISNFNRHLNRSFDTIRTFLALHYRFNRRLDTPFWRECLEKVELHEAARFVEFYRENGPSVLWRRLLLDTNDAREFGTEGHLAMLVGMGVPYDSAYRPSAEERLQWQRIQQKITERVRDAFTVPQALQMIRAPGWKWPDKFYDKPHALRR